MPRTARPQANRTDLLVGGPRPGAVPAGQGQPNGQPVQLPTGLPYGERSQLQGAQQAVPLPQQAQGAPAGAQQPHQPGLTIAQALQASRTFQMPSLGALNRPTERPNEPVTAGTAAGPGGAPPQPSGNLMSTLSRMAAASGSAALNQLAQRAGAVGQ